MDEAVERVRPERTDAEGIRREARRALQYFSVLALPSVEEEKDGVRFESAFSARRSCYRRRAEGAARGDDEAIKAASRSGVILRFPVGTDTDYLAALLNALG